MKSSQNTCQSPNSKKLNFIKIESNRLKKTVQITKKNNFIKIKENGPKCLLSKLDFNPLLPSLMLFTTTKFLSYDLIMIDSSKKCFSVVAG